MGNSQQKNEDQNTSGKKNKFLDGLEKVDKKTCGSCGLGCCKCIAILLSVLVILVSIIVIAACVTTAVAIKLFSSDMSGRTVSLVVLAVTAAVALSLSIYAVVGLFKKKKKALHYGGLLLFVVAVVQALLCGLSVNVTSRDVNVLEESLKESFKLSLEGNPRHLKLWALTSSDLKCCGLYGPDDYRDTGVPPVFPPDVPVFCCPNYNSSQSDISQLTQKEICKASRSYYDVGCTNVVKNLFYNSAGAVLSVTILLIVLEVVYAFQAYIMYRVYQKRERSRKAGESHEAGNQLEAGASNPEQAK